MSNKTVVIIVAVALILFGFIYFVEKDSMSTDDLSDRDDRVFLKFKRDFVDAFSLKGTSKKELSLVKSGSAAEGNLAWTITTPKTLKADDTAVSTVLSALDFLLKGRIIKEADATDLEKYGLNKPRLTGSFEMGGVTTSFKIGGDDVAGKKVYLTVDGRNEIYAVEKDFLKSMDRDLGDLRDKHLIDGTLSEVVSVAVNRKTKISLVRDDVGALWKIMRSGESVLAAQDQVNELLRKVGNLNVESFVADGAKDNELKKYGFSGDDAGSFETVFTSGKKISILFGKPCEDSKNIYVTVAGSGTVVCVGAQIEDVLDRPAGRLTETRLAVFRNDDIEKLSINRNSKTLIMEKNSDGDVWITPQENISLDQDAVNKLLDFLSETRADDVLIGSELIGDLKDPVATVKIVRDSGMGTSILEFYNQDTDAPILVRRKNELAILSMNQSVVLDALSSDLLTFREKTLHNGDAKDIVALEITGPAAQTLKMIDGSWALTKPVEVKVDGARVRDLLNKITNLNVVKFVAKEALSEYGLSDPWAEVSASLVKISVTDAGENDRTDQTTLTLQIGAVAEDNTRYARFKENGKTVFTVGDDLLSLITHPLAAKDLLQINALEVDKVELSKQKGAITAVLEGDDWKSESDDLDSVTLKRLLTDLGSTRAVRADEFSPNTYFERNTLTIKLYKKGVGEAEEPIVLEFGAKSSEPKEDGYLARRSNIPVSFIYPSRVVDEFSALIPEAEKNP